MNKNWKKINKIQKSKIKGGANFLAVWAMSLITVSIFRSLFSNKSNLHINGFGKASWEDHEKKEIKQDEKIRIGLKNYFE